MCTPYAPTGLALVVATVLVSFGTPDAAFAQPSPCGSETECAEEAALLANRAGERFREQDFEAAAVLLREAIALHETPALHHNLARTLVELERWGEASEAYRACLALDPQTASRARIEAEIAEIDARIAHEARPSEATTPGTATPPTASLEATVPPPRQETDPAPWILMGVGVVVAAAGVPFAVLFQAEVDQIRGATSHRDAPSAEDAEVFAVSADVLFGAGGALGLAGLVWGIVTLIEGPSEASVRVRPSAEGGAVEGSF